MAAAKPAPRLFTVDDYYRMADAGILTQDDRVELIEGVIIQMPPVGSRHSWSVRRIARLFHETVGRRAEIAVQDPLRLSTLSEPVPDLVLLHPRSDYQTHQPETSDALLVVEVADSTLTYDRRTKVPLYAREGVPEMWLVEIPNSRVTVHREPTPDGYQLTQAYRPGKQITLLAFPDITISVQDILG
jgi:Uma2 family endonuclease